MSSVESYQISLPQFVDRTIPNLNRDVLQEIFGHLSGLGFGSSNSLKESLAVTCKAFSGWALKELWRELYDIERLCALLPMRDGTIDLIKTSPEKWSRFDFYRNMVEAFTWYSEGESVENLSCLLFHVAPPLFPSLQKLRMCRDMPSQLLHLLVSDTIEEIRIDSWEGNRHFPAFFLVALTQTGKPSQLRLLDCESSNFSVQTLACCIPNFTFLQTLVLDQSDSVQTLIPLLLSMASITSLTLSLPPTFSVDDTLITCFSLEVLNIRGQLSSIIAFLDSINLTSLNRLQIEIEDGGVLPASLDRVFLAFDNRPPLMLRGVDLEIPLAVQGSPPLNILGLFRPLLRARMIQEFRFSTTHPLSVENSDLIQMATAWVDLTSFCIEGKFQAEPSISFLGTFAQNCPRLQELVIPVDTSDLRMEYTPSPVCHSLRYLNPGESKMESPAKAVAVHLYRLFPSVEILYMGSRYTKEWRQVNDVLDAVRLIVDSVN